MRIRSAFYLSVAAIAVAAVLTGAPAQLSAQQAQPSAAVSIGNTELGGVVSGPNGPEAGVWVIAETTDLPTKMAKIVRLTRRGTQLRAACMGVRQELQEMALAALGKVRLTRLRDDLREVAAVLGRVSLP